MQSLVCSLLQPAAKCCSSQEAVEAAAGQADAADGFRIYSKIGRSYILDVL